VSVSARRRLFLLGALGLLILLAWGVTGLEPFGHFGGRYSSYLTARAVMQRKATNVVGAVTFDYRGFDTLGEEFILFASVMGVALLLRAQRDERAEGPARDESPERRAPHDSDAVRELGSALVAPCVLFGVYVVAHGHLTPGGGFQGGVVLATAPLLMYLVGEYAAFRRTSPESLVEVAEGLGAGGYVLIGAIGVVLGRAFLTNDLPLGHAGDLFSAGTILALNLSVGIAVAAGFVLLLSEFLEQTLEVREIR
jgi:multicomponent Na+:H+ antiporter subunit B